MGFGRAIIFIPPAPEVLGALVVVDCGLEADEVEAFRGTSVEVLGVAVEVLFLLLVCFALD